MNAKAPTACRDILRFLNAIWRPGEVREVRIPQYDRYGSTASGYFDSAEALAQAANAWDGKSNIYVTLNPVNPALLARANNRIASKAKNTTCDDDVLHRRVFFLDFDATRPSGISSTDEELAAARELLLTVTGALTHEGWPDPITCLSGNGYYALYEIGLPNTAASTNLVEQALKALAARHNTPEATIDTGVANAARIACLIGTSKMKGDSTEERPHRRSQLLTVPGTLLVVEEGKLRALADQVSTPASPPRTHGAIRAGKSEPLKGILDRQGLDYREHPADAKGITWYHLRRCPFHDDGRDYECGVGQKLPDGAYAGHCFHPEGQGIGWQEWKRALGLELARDHHNRVMVATENDDTDVSDNTPSSPTFNRTDAGNGELFAHLYRGRVLYEHGQKRWLLYGPHHWVEDDMGAIRGLAVTAARHRHHQAVTIQDSTERKRETDYALRSEDDRRIEAMLRQANHQPGLAERATSFNRDPWLLGVANGVVDLRTGTLRPGEPEDLITHSTAVPFDSEAPCTRWERFLAEIFEGNGDMVDYVARAAGYSLAGNTREQCLFLCYGAGANGKSVLLNTLKAAAGEYGHTLAFSALEFEQRAKSDPHVAELVGRRLVVSSEISEGTRLNEAKLKVLTGQDDVPARKLYQNPFSFVPEATLWLAVNHRPLIRDSSDASWRRLKPICFPHRFTEDEIDQELGATLRTELPGILAWMVRGCREWQARGLVDPPEVGDALEDYRAESDPVAEFLAERCVLDPQATVPAGVIYAAYREWGDARRLPDRELLSSTSFGNWLTARFDKKRKNAHIIYFGLRLHP